MVENDYQVHVFGTLATKKISKLINTRCYFTKSNINKKQIMRNGGYYNHNVFVNLSSFEDKHGINKMRERGFKDNVLNRWKLMIYNGSINLACKYYRYDEWCHQYCIFGICKHENKCKGSHRYNLTHLIEHKKFEEAKLLCQYLLHFYTHRCGKQNINKKRAWIAHLHWKLAQVYGKDGFSQYYHHEIAQLHYEYAVKVDLSYHVLFSFVIFVFVAF